MNERYAIVHREIEKLFDYNLRDECIAHLFGFSVCVQCFENVIVLDQREE